MEWPEVQRRIDGGEDNRTEFRRGLGDLGAIGRFLRRPMRIGRGGRSPQMMLPDVNLLVYAVDEQTVLKKLGHGRDRDVITAMEVVPRNGYRIWLRYSDGVCGEVDLSDFAGRGIFAAWSDREFFEKVHVSRYGSIAWSDEVELCEDALYLRLAGKSVEEVMPVVGLLRTNA